ncbi:hypothetical protein B0T16DRAFT_505684 [Cercophora newfieldiana]|uniref:Uncharacterized protein n=1 Tax=Cercophora newfieldiana TaxID=92897 RepID=A0AA40CVG1_9PEZI|nr:hypothetical protein B0T16DRAFT_505684 [Cercophora newfieldiana]
MSTTAAQHPELAVGVSLDTWYPSWTSSRYQKLTQEFNIQSRPHSLPAEAQPRSPRFNSTTPDESPSQLDFPLASTLFWGGDGDSNSNDIETYPPMPCLRVHMLPQLPLNPQEERTHNKVNTAHEVSTKGTSLKGTQEDNKLYRMRREWNLGNPGVSPSVLILADTTINSIPYQTSTAPIPNARLFFKNPKLNRSIPFNAFK